VKVAAFGSKVLTTLDRNIRDAAVATLTDLTPRARSWNKWRRRRG